jgi:hypothetical protein
MGKITIIFVFGTVVWSIGVITHVNFGSIVRDTNKLINQCQKELPRNQKCVLIAVPEDKNE